MYKLVQTLRIITRDGVSSLRSFRVETEPKPSFSHVTENCIMRAQEIGFLRFKIHNILRPQGQYGELTFQIWSRPKLERRSYLHFMFS